MAILISLYPRAARMNSSGEGSKVLCKGACSQVPLAHVAYDTKLMILRFTSISFFDNVQNLKHCDKEAFPVK
jgi:hypothetical protein